jgi:rare lipoprotein A
LSQPVTNARGNGGICIAAFLQPNDDTPFPGAALLPGVSESLERTMTGRVLKASRACLRFRAALAISLLVVLQLQGCARLPHYESRSEPASQKETGIASYYAKKFHRRKTASGESLDNHALTAAHKTLPLGSRVVVRNVNNGKSVTVRITDRGPYVKGRIIDLTQGAFSRIASLDKGVAKVEIRVVN